MRPADATFIDVAELGELPLGAGCMRVVRGLPIAFRDGRSIYAIDDVCLRCTRPLATALVERTVVTCACGWRYHLTDGQVRGVPGLQADRYPVKLIGTRVLVGKVPLLNSRAVGLKR